MLSGTSEETSEESILNRSPTHITDLVGKNLPETVDLEFVNNNNITGLKKYIKQLSVINLSLVLRLSPRRPNISRRILHVGSRGSVRKQTSNESSPVVIQKGSNMLQVNPTLFQQNARKHFFEYHI